MANWLFWGTKNVIYRQNFAKSIAVQEKQRKPRNFAINISRGIAKFTTQLLDTSPGPIKFLKQSLNLMENDI